MPLEDSPLLKFSDMADIKEERRHAYTCLATPKFRNLWRIDLARLAEYIHVPLGVFAFVTLCR